MIGLFLILVGVIFTCAGSIVIARLTINTTTALKHIVEARKEFADKSAEVNANLKTVSTDFSTFKTECAVRLQDIIDLQLDHDNIIKAHELEIKRLKERTRPPK